MASLTDKRIKNTYDGLLKTTDNDPLGGSYKLITDGLGNSSNVYLGTGGAVGIGQATPRGKFDVDGELYVTTPNGINSLKISDLSVKIGDYEDDAGYAFLDLDSQVFKFTTDSVEVMRITSSGNVGVGTISPAEKLHIEGSVDNDDVAIRIDNDSDDNSSLTPPSAAVLFQTASNNGHIRVFGAPADTAANHKMDIGSTASSSYLTFSPSTTEKMRISSNGNIGINTNNPQSKLSVDSGSNGIAGFISVDSQGLSRLKLGYSFTAAPSAITAAQIYADSSGNLDISSRGNIASKIQFYTSSGASPAERMRIDSTGQVQINTYGSGTFTGTVARNLAVDSSGNIIENQANTRSVFVATSTDTTTNINATTTVNWNSESIKDTGFTHSNTTNPNEITITQAGTYKVYACITYTTTVQRPNVALEILVNNVSTGARGAGGYVRSSAGHNDASTIVEDYVTVSANDVVKIQTSQEANSGTVNLRSGESKLIIEKLTGLTLSTTDANTLNGFSSTDFVAVSGDAMTGGLTIDGDLGVGTSTPSNAVHVVGNGVRIVSTATNANSGEIRLGLAGNNSIPHFEMGNSSTPNSFRISNAGYYQLGTTVDTDLRFNVNNNTAIHIESTNRFIGLNGIVSPLSLLSINNVNSQIGWQNSGTVRAFIGYLRSGNDTNLRFGTSIAGDSEAEEKMRIDSSGNVGIGTTSPNTLMHTFGSGNVAKFQTTSFGGINLSRENNVGNNSTHFVISFNNSDSEISYIKTLNKTGGTTSTGTGYEMQFATLGSGYQTFYTNGSERMRINSSGNVGIGTTSPDTILEVVGENPILTIRDTSTGLSSANSALRIAESGSGDTLGNYWDLKMKPESIGGTTNFAIANSILGDVFNINYQANVGIGTTSPQAKLEVGDCDSSGNIGDGNIAVKTNSNNTAIVIQESSGAEQWGLGVNADGDLIFTDSGTERIRFADGTGNVGIGTSSPAEKLTVSASDDVVIRINSTKNGTWTSGDSLGAVEFFGNDASGGQQAGIKGKIDVVSYNEFGAAFDMKFFTSNGSADPTTENFKIAYDGGIFAPALSGGTSISNPMIRYNTSTKEFYYQSSSLRYKEEVENLDSQIDKLMNLRTVKFKIKDTNENAIGLIAEEVVEVIPELTFKNKVEGFDEPQIEGVSYGDLPTYLLKAIQEQQEMINELKTEIQTLKSQINL
jgi:hypothetical protein